MNPLPQLWQQTWNELGGHPPKGWLNHVLEAWDEPHRHYHTRHHLEDCLVALQPVRQRCRHPGEVALAVWFHDVVYDTHSATNEADSADLAEQALFEAGLTGPVVGRVRSLILATGHVGGPATTDEAVLCDIDVLVLGSDPERYRQYQQGIRQEYGWVPETVFKEGRSKVLEAFLEQPKIYRSPDYQERFETPARRNLQRELKGLKRGTRWFTGLLNGFL